METLIDLVSSGARRWGDRPALLIRPTFRTRTWRYRDLAWTVPRVAGALAEVGLAQGDRAIIWAVNRPEWGIGFLAIAHAGAVTVPLDVRHSVEFGREVAARTEARLVLASRQTMASARELGLPIVAIESLPDLARRHEPAAPAALTPEDLAEIVYTSGTTGAPRGVMLSHGNLMWCATTLTEVLPLAGHQRLLSVLPLSHLYEQVCGFLGPLVVGASVVYPISRQPAVLLRTFRDFRVTMLLIVPQGLRMLDSAIGRRVDEAGRRDTFERLLRLAPRLPRPFRRILFRPVLSRLGGALHTIGVGSAALDVEIAERWRAIGVDVLQGYGMTEMSPAISFTRPERNTLGSVGELVPGVEVRIAGDGEILARSPGRFQGYWHDPEATRRAVDDGGWYHTGDLGELSAAGLLTLRGRKKDMLALPDGQKVYPEDVEAILELDSRLRGATVVGWPPGPDLRVHAVLVLDDPTLADAVVRDANARLGAHQQIRGLTIWPDEDLPRTVTLKVRKHDVLARLEELARDGAAPATTRAAPASAAGRPRPRPVATEVDPVIAIAASLAGLEPSDVRPSDRLSSDLNLDSLQRVELLGVIEEELGTYLDDDALDPDATLAELTMMVAAARDAGRHASAWTWPLHPAVRAFGLAVQALIMGPAVRLMYDVRTTGIERLRSQDGPILLTPNHCLHADNYIILSQLPLAFRWRLSIAAAADTIYARPLRGVLASLLGNAFPLRREGGVRRSLELLGIRLDRRFSILLYPEGKLTVGGPMQPFKAGVGLIAVEGSITVVPVKLHVRRMALFDRRRLPAPLRGKVELVFGEPVRFDADVDPAEATTRLERLVAAL